MRELIIALSIIAAACIMACAFRYTPILVNGDVEGVLDRWTGQVSDPLQGACGDEQGTRL
jgi:hypothetical protein